MLSSIRGCCSKFKRLLKRGCSFLGRNKGTIFKIFLFLGTVAFIVSLVMTAIQGVDVLSQAVIINKTEQKIYDGDYTNQIHTIGLGSYFFNMPKRKFLIYFTDDENIESQYQQGLITGRVQEGTKVKISATIQCKIGASNLRLFLEEYGLNWHIYPIEKTKNVIIQNIRKTKFYELNNTVLLSQINTQFTSYLSISGYPFTFSIINIRIQYPQQSFSLNNTLGINLLHQKSLLNQYNNRYTILQTKVNNNLSILQSYASRIGSLKGKIQKQHQEIQSQRTNWLRGLQVCNGMFGNNEEYVRRYLWVYFQNIYNSTYRQ